MINNVPPLAAMRAEAKRMKLEGNGEFSNSECLNAVARKYGFAGWRRAMYEHPAKQPKQRRA